MTIKVYRLYCQISQLLKRFSVPEPNSSALNILQKSLEIPYPRMHTKKIMFSTCSKYHLRKAETMFKKRRTLMPIQYVIGEWEFRDLLLKMRKPVLIPRQETSGLVEIVQNKLKLQQFQGKSNINFLEIGCGSGAISLSLLKENINLSGVAIDLQKHCVQLTNENANLNKIDKRKLVVLHQSWKEFMSQQESLHKQQQLDYPQFDFIVSNPPYIPTNQIKSLDKSVRNFEDVCALDGGVEGLDLILSILEKGHSILKPGGFIAMEVDRTHNKQLLKLYDEQKEFFHFYSSREFFKDIYSQDRFCLFFKKN